MMRTRRKTYKLLLTFTLLLFTSATVWSQSITQNEPSQELEEEAQERRDMWTRELALTDKQALLMEKKIIEFGMKREELIQSKMPEEAKTERLQALQVLEYKDMRDILTKPQFDRYLTIKTERIDRQKQEDQ